MRPHPGQAAAAANMRRVLAESPDRGEPQRSGLLAGPGRVLAALRTPGRGRGTRHRRACPHRRRPRIGQCRRQSRRHARRTRRIQRQLPRRPGRLRAGLPRHRRRRSGEHQRAAHRPVPRCRPQPRPEPVPGRRPRRGQRAHDRAVHAGRDRVRTQAAGQPGQRRLDPVVGDAGGPRLHGMVGGAQAAQGHRRTDPGAGDRGVHRGARYRDACPAGSLALPPPPSSPRSGSPFRDPAPTATCRRRSMPLSHWPPRATLVAAAESVTGPLA